MVGLIHGFMGGEVAGAHDGTRLGEELLPYPRAWRTPLSPAAEKPAGRSNDTIRSRKCKCLGERRAVRPTWEGQALAWGRFPLRAYARDRNPCGTDLRPNAKSLKYYDEKPKTDTIWLGWAEKK
jgi:hypothetical protein